MDLYRQKCELRGQLGLHGGMSFECSLVYRMYASFKDHIAQPIIIKILYDYMER